jgi:nitronate monooxygenase
MALDPGLRAQLTLPAICAPMFLVTGPDLVREACKAGLIAGLPRQNARSIEQFDQWLGDIRAGLNAYRHANPDARIGPLAVNLATRFDPADLRAHLALCRRHGVEIVISATGDPTDLIAEVHDWGGKVFHDVVSMRFAEKAIRAGADGLNCVGAGGGGHSGKISPIVLVPRIRAIFDGTIVMAGSISTGAQIRAAEILGADLAYLGTRFIATREAAVDPDYKEMLVSGTSADLMFTGKVAGVPANWLVESMRRVGLDPENLPLPHGSGMRHDHLPSGVKPWKNLWSAGQGIDLIDDIPSVADLVMRLRREYVAACEMPSMADVASLPEAFAA